VERISDAPIAAIEPDWDAPSCVCALSTTRAGGVSDAPYRSLNLATHVGDDPRRVALNRARLAAALNLPSEPVWLEQVHGCDVANADEAGNRLGHRRADAAAAHAADRICAVLTADCLPVLLCDADGAAVGAVHAGWRGLLGGVLEAAVAALRTPPERMLAWLGPAIGPRAFEVGPEVRAGFMAHSAQAAGAFQPGRADRWLADLYLLARQRLAAAGVERVSGGGCCTFSDGARFFSYRRDGQTGRMASLIWLRGGRARD
jgi:YfiH family protein